MKLKKTQGILASAAKSADLQSAWVSASKAAKVLGCPTLKAVDQKIWGPKMDASKKKADFVVDCKPENDVLNMTVKLHIGSEYSTLGIAKKSEAELKADAVKQALQKSGIM